jgi:hypothetical protein
MSSTHQHTMYRFGLGAAFGMLLGGGAAAQALSTEALERQTEEAFRTVVQQPQDLAQWSRYAQLLVDAGNYEGGIAALERLLLDPNSGPELRVQIAVLYYRLGSYAMAESMARDALADGRLQGDARATAESLLADTVRRNQRNQFSGSVVFGVRHQSNPTYRSEDALVYSGGTLVPLPADQRPTADNDLSLGLTFQHQYDLERQNSAAIASSFSAYLVDYRSSTGSEIRANQTKPYDLQVVDFTSGLLFKPAPVDLAALTLRPHVIFSNVVAQGHQYLRSQGLGLDAAWRPSERTLVEATLDGQDRTFADRVDVINADLLGGRLWGLRGRVSREVAAGHVLTGEYAMRRNETSRPFYDYDSNELRFTYVLSYPGLIAGKGYWTTVLWLGALRRSYGAPDPTINSLDTRQDREWRVGISHSVPLAAKWALVLSAEYVRNDANLPNFRYTNTLLSGVVSRSF